MFDSASADHDTPPMNRKVLSMAVVTLSLAACIVPKKKLEEKQAEADGCYKALQSENAKRKQLAQATAELQAKVDEMQAALGEAKLNSGELQRLQAELEEKANAIEHLQTEKAELEKKSHTYEDLMNGLKKEIDDGQVKIKESQGRLSVDLIDRILFDSGSTTIKPAGGEALRKVAAVLRTVKDRQILVAGHTDAVDIRGELSKTFPTNWELSAARATTVVRFLEDAGVDPSNLGAAGFSKFQPVADNTSESGKSQNRRIEIVLTPKTLVAK